MTEKFIGANEDQLKEEEKKLQNPTYFEEWLVHLMADHFQEEQELQDMCA